ncbi:MAG TPA: hypothetical protein VIJ65_08605 [Acidobacteriaceae bacterium]
MPPPAPPPDPHTRLRAHPPRPPVLTATQHRAELTRLESLCARLRLEQRSLLRGLILLALVILLASLAHAGFSRLFVPGWWRQW